MMTVVDSILGEVGVGGEAQTDVLIQSAKLMRHCRWAASFDASLKAAPLDVLPPTVSQSLRRCR